MRMSEEDFDKVIDVNLKSSIWLKQFKELSWRNVLDQSSIWVV
jgi:hypothetical protein